MAPTPPPASSKPKGNILTKKVGPLPGWAWALAIVIVGFIAYRAYKARQDAAANQATAPASTDTLGTGATDSGAAGAALGGTPDSGTGGVDLSSLLQ